MKKNARKLALHRESLRILTPTDVTTVQGAAIPSIKIGCTSEYTWYCPTHSACSYCPICEIQ